MTGSAGPSQAAETPAGARGAHGSELVGASLGAWRGPAVKSAPVKPEQSTEFSRAWWRFEGTERTSPVQKLLVAIEVPVSVEQTSS